MTLRNQPTDVYTILHLNKLRNWKSFGLDSGRYSLNFSVAKRCSLIEPCRQLIDDAPADGEDPDNAEDPSSKSKKKGDKDSGKDIPKDDAAKEKLRAEQEMKDANAALQKYGYKRFLRTYWRFIAMDNPGIYWLLTFEGILYWETD